MSEWEINYFGWLIVGLIALNIGIRYIYEWRQRKFEYRTAIERRISDYKWRKHLQLDKERQERLGITTWDHALYARAGIK